MELPKGNIQTLQKYMAEKISTWGFEDETLQERLLLLSEEVGELIHASRKLTGMNVNINKEQKNEASEEAADVLNMILAVAVKLDIDLEKVFREKCEKLDKRQYKRHTKSL